jgi:hypothetical protein
MRLEQRRQERDELLRHCAWRGARDGRSTIDDARTSDHQATVSRSRLIQPPSLLKRGRVRAG